LNKIKNPTSFSEVRIQKTETFHRRGVKKEKKIPGPKEKQTAGKIRGGVCGP